MSKPNRTTIKAITPATIAEIQPALSSPDFDPSHVIMVLDLPAIPFKDCRSEPLGSALAIIDEICARLKIPSASVDQVRQPLEQIIAAGNTPILKLWAEGARTRIDFGQVSLTAFPRPASPAGLS
jgi:hypothetical protein